MRATGKRTTVSLPAGSCARSFLCFILPFLWFSGCSIQKAAYNAVSDALAPEYGTVHSDEPDPMTALTGENDPELVAAFFPAALKIYEMMLIQNPQHRELGIMTGQLCVMYANAFIQTPAERLPSDRFDEQNRQYLRALNLYRRGFEYALSGLEIRKPGISRAVHEGNLEFLEKALEKFKITDVPGLYWTGAGLLAAFSLDPLNSYYSPRVPAAVALLERAAGIHPEFNNGAIFEVLLAFYAAAPESLGGGMDKALEARDRALEISAGSSPSLFIACARSIAVPTQDSGMFTENIDKALAIDPDSQPENRLALLLAREQALWLKEHKSEFILFPED